MFKVIFSNLASKIVNPKFRSVISYRLFVIAGFILVMGLASAPTEEAYRILPLTGDFDNPGGDLAEADIAWRKFTNFFENEACYMLARLDQGYWIFMTIFTFKYGPQQEYGVYALTVSDDGKQWFAKREVLLKEASVSHDNISWESKGTSISGSYPVYRFTLNEEAFKADISVESRFPGWKLGRWNLTEDGKNFGEVFIFIPWGKASGSITLDGKRIPVTGNAYADRFHGSARYDRTDPLFYAVRAVSPTPGSSDISIITGFNHLNPAYGKFSTPSLMLMEPDGFKKATQKVIISGEDFYKDPKLGYSFPRRLIVASDDKDFRLRGVFRANRNLEMLDILSQLPPYIRKLAAVFFKLPVFSKWDGIFEGSYSLKGKEQTFRIRAVAEINFIGGP